MADLFSLMLMLTGAVFMLLAAVGVLRMPDLYLRMSAISKAATLGVICVLLGAALHFADFAISARIIAIVVFLILTAPVAAHKIGRAAYLAGPGLWRGTRWDELKGRYDHEQQQLASVTCDRQEAAGSAPPGDSPPAA
ncbi:MAG: monovalent cation/H(+) antiporter subunit G [candidate division KSB1 bacterium]|nr:monovalent cation/H(+) antiporter subunit G [candidate division KSB1 bacterium]MDZ7273459.1 monovalent cation/H(+) antiporter subunit G [candidate division KSB1 bacterium]MDZ7286949.1 monovalent cation/H(+) antiporter subunit G [candidate division KSB1 bacterium]MDZ7299698.1 monovalent cation/H(+) antiporter subunit G [candidate division KSB1 bacterium]MDZ7308704.1 monovalent cation/H(+) antiporter subunit G [candidate division KSB1 bacterium]